MGCGESSCHLFCVRVVSGARGGVGNGEEEGVFGVGEEVTESEW